MRNNKNRKSINQGTAPKQNVTFYSLTHFTAVTKYWIANTHSIDVAFVLVMLFPLLKTRQVIIISTAALYLNIYFHYWISLYLS